MTDGECDVSDILCQEKVKLHLQGLQTLVGTEVFQKLFPELTALGSKLEERIAEQANTLQSAYDRCKNTTAQELPVLEGSDDISES